VPSGAANVCLVVPGPVAAGLDDPPRLLLQTIADDPEIRERFAAARMTVTPVVLGPLAVDAVAPGSPGLLLAGDAAGFIDPMTGDGLRFAVRGGELAAEAALSALAGRLARPHLHLARLRRREFAAKWRFKPHPPPAGWPRHDGGAGGPGRGGGALGPAPHDRLRRGRAGPVILPVAAGLVVFLLMAIEAALASRHDRGLRALGAVEPAGDVYPRDADRLSRRVSSRCSGRGRGAALVLTPSSASARWSSPSRRH